MTQKPINRILLAFRLLTEEYPGRIVSADDLHKLLMEHDGNCDVKTARGIWENLVSGFSGSELFIVRTAMEKRGEKKIPTRVMQIMVGKK